MLDLNALPQKATQTEEVMKKAIDLFVVYGMDVLAAVIILIAGWTVACWAQRLTLKGMRKAKMDETLARFLSSLIRYAILGFTGIAVLSKFGIQTTSLVAVLGAAGLAIGLAMQGTLSHVAAGVMLLIFRPFKIGDYIEAGGEAGTVDEIGLFFTSLNTPDNVHIIIPNSHLWDASLKNYSANKQRRVDILVGIGYGDDIEKAQKVLMDLMKKDKRTLTKPAAPQTMVKGLGASSVDINMRVWVQAADYWAYTFDMNKAVKNALDKNGISIPFPQRDIHIVADVKAPLKKAK